MSSSSAPGRGAHKLEAAAAAAADPADSSSGPAGIVVARRCAACRYLRRRCAPGGCVLAPYFPASQPQRFADVHAVFGTSNATRLLQSLPAPERGRAADTMAAEARWRVQDPVYGSAGLIHRLQQDIRAAQRQLATTRAQLATVRAQAGTAAAQGPPPPPPSLPPPPPPLAAAAATHTTIVVGRHDAMHGEEDDDQAPLMMDPDEFLDLDGRF